MKLKFELKRANIENLHKLLSLTAQLWKNDEDKIFFYFDQDQMIIYPENRSGFDKVFARIHINNANPKMSDGSSQNFFASYTIKSQKEKSAILISPQDLNGFIQDLKILVDLNYDAMFKLAQCVTNDQVQKYIEVTGTSGVSRDREKVRSYIQIDSHFDKNLFPEEIEAKQIQFGIESNTCMNVLSKFRSRLAILSDEIASISFKASDNQEEGTLQINEESGLAVSPFVMTLKSKHMKTMVTNKGYPAKPKGPSDLKSKYKVQLKKEVFIKFFSILKLQGQGLIKINHNESIEMEYTLEKCPYLSLVLETGARAI